MPEHEGYDFSQGLKPCRIKEGWEDAGRQGFFFGTVYVDGLCWAIIKLDEEQEPQLHKATGVEVPQDKWQACNA